MIQIDLGNLAVGLGTAYIAWVSHKSIRNSQKQILEDKKHHWKQEVCQLCAKYFSLCYELSRKQGSASKTEVESIYKEVKQLKMQLNFLLNEEKHSEVLNELDEVLNKAFKGEAIPVKSFLQKARCFLDRTVS